MYNPMYWRKLYGPNNKYLTTHSILKEDITEEDDVYGTTYHGGYSDENAIVERCREAKEKVKKPSPTFTHTNVLKGEPARIKEKPTVSPTFVSLVKLEYPESELLTFTSNRTPGQYPHTQLWGDKAQPLMPPALKISPQYPHTPLWGKNAALPVFQKPREPSVAHKHTDIFKNVTNTQFTKSPPSNTYTHSSISDVQLNEAPLRSTVSDTYASTPLWGVNVQPMQKSEVVSPTHVHTNIFSKSEPADSFGYRHDRNAHTTLWGAKAQVPVVVQADKVSPTYRSDLLASVETLSDNRQSAYTHTPFWAVDEAVRKSLDKVSPTYQHTPIWNASLVNSADEASEESSDEDEKEEEPVKAGARWFYSHTPLW